jgi:hypothetical protein
VIIVRFVAHIKAKDFGAGFDVPGARHGGEGGVGGGGGGGGGGGEKVF